MAWVLISLMLFAYTVICVFLIFVILIQSGKGGGLSSLGSSSQGISETLGATGAEKTLNKVTTWCAIGYMVLALGLSLVGSHTVSGSGDRIFKTPAGEAQAPISAQPEAIPTKGKPAGVMPKVAGPAAGAAKQVLPVNPATANKPAPPVAAKPVAPAQPGQAAPAPPAQPAQPAKP